MTYPVNRRLWLSTLGLAALAACTRNEGTGFFGYALVACSGDNSLSSVDLTSFRFHSTIPLNSSPAQVLDGGRGQGAYALTPANGTVHLIHPSLKSAIARRLADHVTQIVLPNPEQSLMALASHSRELLELDRSSLKRVARHRFSIPPDSMDFSTNGYVAVASSAGGIELLQLRSGVRTRVETPKLGAIRFRSDGKVLLAANTEGRSLLALDVPTLRTIAELPLAMQPDNWCFNADQGQLFISGAGMDGVAVVFPFNTMEVDQTLLAGRTPGTMACSAAPALLFVGSNTAEEVCILNIDTRKVAGFVETGGHPSFIRITPDSNFALIFDRAAGDMAVIRVPAIKTTADAKREKTGASLFTMLSVGSQPVDAAVISGI